MLSITLLLQVPQTIAVRYVFGFVREIITRVVHISLRSLHRVQYVRLLLFYSVIFSPSFSSPANSAIPYWAFILIRWIRLVDGSSKCSGWATLFPSSLPPLPPPHYSLPALFIRLNDGSVTASPGAGGAPKLQCVINR